MSQDFNEEFQVKSGAQMVAYLKALGHQTVEDFAAILQRGGWRQLERGCGVVPFQKGGEIINIYVEEPHDRITGVALSR